MYSEYAAHAAVPALPEVHRAPPSQAGHAGTLAVIMQRIEEAIDAETAGIRGDPGFDLKASNARKSRALYELSKALKAESGPRPEHQPAIVRLQAKLAANERAIRAHLSAVTEVAALIQNAIQAAETDGTYSSMEFGRV